MKAEKNTLDRLRNKLKDITKLVFDYFVLFYYFLKRLFSYDFFMKSVTTKQLNTDLVDDELEKVDAELEKVDAEDKQDFYYITDDHKILSKPYVESEPDPTLEHRAILKQKQLYNFYKYFTFPHPTYLKLFKSIRINKRRKKVYVYKNYYIKNLVGTKRSTADFGSVLDRLKGQRYSNFTYFDITKSKHYQYLNKSNLNTNPELVNEQFFEELNAESRAEIMKVLNVHYKLLSLVRSVPALTDFANLNLTLKDYSYTINNASNNLEFIVVDPALKKKILTRTVYRYLFEFDITLQLLKYKLVNFLKLTLLKFDITRNYFFKEHKVLQGAVSDNIYYDLIFDKQYYNLDKKLSIINLYDFYNTSPQPNLNFYFFKKLRLLDVYFYVNFDDINYEQRYKLFSAYLNGHSNYKEILKNFKIYKINNEKNLIVTFNRVTKNLPYIKDFLKYDLPFHREFEGDFYRSPTLRLQKDGATYLNFRHFLNSFYFDTFSKIKSTYFDNLTTVYKQYNKSKLNNATLQRPKPNHILALKFHFDKLYNFNFVEPTVIKLYNFSTGNFTTLNNPAARYYLFDYLPTIKPDQFKLSFLTSKVFGANGVYFSNDEEKPESILKSIARSNSDHLDIPLYFKSSFMFYDTEHIDSLSDETSPFKNFFIKSEVESLDRIYQKLNGTATSVQQQKLKKSIKFNNKTKLPNINKFFIFDFLTSKVSLVKKQKSFSTSTILNFFFVGSISYLTLALCRIVLNYKNHTKVEKIFQNVYNLYSTLLFFLFVILFFFHFFTTLDFFVVTNYVLVYFTFVNFHLKKSKKIDIEISPTQPPKLNFSYLRYSTLKNFYKKHFVDKDENNNFLYNNKGKKLDKNLFGLEYYTDLNAEETSVKFDQIKHNKTFFGPELANSILFVLSICWFDFYFLNFVIFLSLFFFKFQLSFKVITNKSLYLTAVMAFEIILILFFYSYYSQLFYYGGNATFFCNSVLTILLFLISYAILKIK